MIDPNDSGVNTFEEHRDRLFGIAYRMTGSVADAEDICQDAWLRWSAVGHGAIDNRTVDNPEAYLVSITTRLCIDRMGTAAKRRETYVGPYLPEPLVSRPAVAGSTPGPQPEHAAELADSLTLAFLILLDQLGPAERAAFLLHDVFGYPFDEVAAAIDRSPDATRQLASRARRRIDADRKDYRRGLTDENQSVITLLLTAISAGDVEATMALLAPDIVQLDDGGALVRAGRRPIIGPHRVARLWVNLAKRIRAGQTMDITEVNGLPGLVFSDSSGPFMVVEIAIGPDGLVHRLNAQLNPDKLAHLR